MSVTDAAVTAERLSLTANSGTEEAEPTGHSWAVSLSGFDMCAQGRLWRI